MRNQILGFFFTFYIWKMLQVKKRKKHLAKIALLVVKNNKRYKDIRQIEKEKVF